jgi:hypothetical protein
MVPGRNGVRNHFVFWKARWGGTAGAGVGLTPFPAADVMRGGGLVAPYDMFPGSLMQELHRAYDPPRWSRRTCSTRLTNLASFFK